jgi:hypothetical protein
MFKIESLSLAPTTELILKHPATGEVVGEEGAPVTFVLYGEAARQYGIAVDKMTRRNKKRAQNSDTTYVETIANSAEFLADLTVEVKNMEYNGAPLDNREAFVALYNDKGLGWIRSQVSDAVVSVESFLKQ